MTDLEAVWLAIEQSEADTNTLLVAADAFAEADESKIEAVLRWMAKWDKRPRRNSDSGPNPWMWTCYGGLCGEIFKCGTNHALPRVLCARLGFWEWRCYPSYRVAVRQLADALLLGEVDCNGNPEKPEPTEADRG